MEGLIEDVFFYDGYPAASNKLTRYHSIADAALDLAKKENPLPVYEAIRERMQSELRYARGIISMVCALSFCYISLRLTIQQGEIRVRNHRSTLKTLCASLVDAEYGVSSLSTARVDAWLDDTNYIYVGDVDVSLSMIHSYALLIILP